jgi:nucleoid DNA-binding protein
MTKAELVDDVAERVQLPKYQAEAVVTSVLQSIMDALRAGDTVALRGFGSFRLHRRQPDATQKRGTRCRFRPLRSPSLRPGKPSERR